MNWAYPRQAFVPGRPDAPTVRLRKFCCFATTLVLVLVGGCGTFYFYREIGYPNAEAAIEAQQQFHARLLSQIEPTALRIGGKARIVLPARQRILERAEADWPRALVAYVATILERHLETFAQAIVIRGIFDEVEIMRTVDTANPEIGTADYVIWWNMPDQQPAEWYIRSRTSDGHIVEMDSTLPQGALRWTGWLETIAAVARENRP